MFVCSAFKVSAYISLSVHRYGKPGCDAETCDYFLSYRRIGTDVEYEMSADTDGWVAVGFSSDKKMVSSCTAFVKKSLRLNLGQHNTYLCVFYLMYQTKLLQMCGR